MSKYGQGSFTNNQPPPSKMPTPVPSYNYEPSAYAAVRKPESQLGGNRAS